MKRARGDFVYSTDVFKLFFQGFDDQFFHIFGRIPGENRRNVNLVFNDFWKIFPRHGDVRVDSSHHDDKGENVNRYAIVYRPTGYAKFFVMFAHVYCYEFMLIVY